MASLLPTNIRAEDLRVNLEALKTWGKLTGTGENGVRVHRGTVENMLCDAALSPDTDSESDRYWAGASWPVAAHLAVNGWHDGLALVEGLYARLTAQRTETILPQYVLSDEPEGDVDVERWIEGDDQCFSVAQQTGIRVSAAGTFVRFIIDPFASCSVDVDAILTRGVYIAALVYLHEKAGYRTAIDWRMPNTGSGWNWLLEVAVKRFEDTLDLPRHLFWIAHPAALRQVVIRAYHCYRTDGIRSRCDSFSDPTAVVCPGILPETDLTKWQAEIMTRNGLTIGG